MKTKFALLLIIVSNTVTAQENTVLTSIKPIQMIAQEIMQGAGEPDVLLTSNASPHDYALKPSDAKKIIDADLVIWYGKDLEPFLVNILEKQPSTIELYKIDGLALREFIHDGDDHDGHDHGNYDPHFWLGYQPTLQVAKYIASQLSQMDEKNSKLYQANYNHFEQKYAAKKAEITARLAKVKNHGYYVFHDAYGYFEQDYELNHLGHFTVSPERKPGAKTLIKIRNKLKAQEAKCVFSEPQYTPAVIQSVMRGSQAKLGVLDPVASDITVEAGSYFEFIDQISQSFVKCLSE